MAKRSRTRGKPKPRSGPARTSFDPGAEIERMMAACCRLMEESGLCDDDEIQALLDARRDDLMDVAPAPSTPLQKAQELCWTARGARTTPERAALARQALELCPDCADAYVILAEDIRDPEEGLALARQGVAAGERALRGLGLWGKRREFWRTLETRPYMRAQYEVGLCLVALERSEEGAEVFQELLRLNPDDHQGVRQFLGALLFALRRDTDLDLLLRKYDDPDALWAYLKAFLELRRRGVCESTRQAFRKAVACNPYVAQSLLGMGLPSCESLQPYYRIGGEGEAWECMYMLSIALVPNLDWTETMVKGLVYAIAPDDELTPELRQRLLA